MKTIKFKNTVNLAETKFGSKIIYRTDEFFGAANRILSEEKPVFKTSGKFLGLPTGEENHEGMLR